MRDYSSMSNDQAADAYADDCGMDELRDEAIAELSAEYADDIYDNDEIDGEGLAVRLVVTKPDELMDAFDSVDWRAKDNRADVALALFDKLAGIVEGMVNEYTDAKAEEHVDEVDFDEP